MRLQKRCQHVALCICMGFVAACTPNAPGPPESASPARQGIVSFGPNITEALFALGLGDRVVAVTSLGSDHPLAQPA